MYEYAKIYSEQGLREFIKETEKEIKEKQKEYQDIYEGKRYNPLCRDSWLMVIQKDIDDLKKNLKEYKKALKVKQSK